MQIELAKFLTTKKSDDTLIMKFPEAWKNSEKALFLAAALNINAYCYFK